MHNSSPPLVDMVLLQDDWIGPDATYLLSVVVALITAGVTVVARYKRGKYTTNANGKKTTPSLLRSWGIKIKNIKRAMIEIERKTFHMCGLLVPLTHMILLRYGYTNAFCIKLCWSITLFGWIIDLARLQIPFVARHWPMRSILRDHEKTQLTGGAFFSLGCTLSISLSPPSVAMTSILFLVCGDMSAAIIGVSFGGEVAHVKLGRAGKKSLEGSVAMFIVCFCISMITFAAIPIREYASFLAALVATVTELYEPFGLNDNLTIPVFSALALQFGFLRVRCPTCSCTPLR
mmetsp:Transcript_3929/g.5500  ORF Transcript_3929/g.5500 Transcript_3929/m.5500 type:complete len:290 (+) Transcript_3929:80-949(+)